MEGREEHPFRIRGHTLLCLQGFRGEGYSPEFIRNMGSIHAELLRNPSAWVEVVEEPDAICGACPHRMPAGCGLNGDASEEGMQAQDGHVLRLLGLRPGDRLRWHEILDRIGRSLSGSSLPDICGQCRWLPLGYCREGIDRLRSSEVIGVQSSVCGQKRKTEN